MAFPTTSVLDNFNRPNVGPPPSASWSTPTGAGGLIVSGNQCWPQSGSGWAVWNPNTFGADSEAYITLGTVDSTTHIAGVRGQSTGALSTIDGYYVGVPESFGAHINLYRLDNGVATQLGASTNQTLAAGDKVGIEIIGTTIKGYYRVGAGAWTEKLSRTDSTYASAGSLFLELVNVAFCDDFGGGTVVAGGIAYTQSISGGVTPAATIAKRPASTKTGALSPAATLVKRTAHALTGGITPAAALAAIKIALKTLAGALTSGGTLVRLIATTKTGSIMPAASVVKQITRSLTGGLTPAGVLGAIKTVLKALSGALTSSGVLARQTDRALTGTLSPAGTQTRQVIKRLAGLLASSGALSSWRTVLVALSGSLTSTGALLRQTGKRLASGLSPTGSLARMVAKVLAGVLTTGGALTSALNGYVPVIVRDIVTGISYITRSRSGGSYVTRQQADTAYITQSNSKDTEF